MGKKANSFPSENLPNDDPTSDKAQGASTREIVFRCLKCGKRLRAGRSVRGRQAKCDCGHTLTVPIPPGMSAVDDDGSSVKLSVEGDQTAGVGGSSPATKADERARYAVMEMENKMRQPREKPITAAGCALISMYCCLFFAAIMSGLFIAAPPRKWSVMLNDNIEIEPIQIVFSIALYSVLILAVIIWKIGAATGRWRDVTSGASGCSWFFLLVVTPHLLLAAVLSLIFVQGTRWIGRSIAAIGCIAVIVAFVHAPTRTAVREYMKSQIKNMTVYLELGDVRRPVW